MTTPVQTKEGHLVSSAGVTTATLNIVLTAPATVGNAIVVAINGGGGQVQTVTSVTDDQGNAYTVNSDNWNGTFFSEAATATFVNLANAPQTISIKVGTSVASTIGICATVYEVPGAWVVDAAAHGNTGSTTALAASFTAAAANEFAVCALINNNSAATYTQNNGWTQDGSVDLTVGGYAFHDTLTSSGANSLNATASTAVFQQWAIVSLQPAVAQVPFMNYGFQPRMAQ